MDNAKYIIDSSVFIRRSLEEEYDEEAFPFHWKNFDMLVREGVIVFIGEVKEELITNEDDFFLDWTIENQHMFYSFDDSDTIPFLLELYSMFPNWYEENEDKADLYLVAFAKSKGLTLVTQESMNLNAEKDENYKIPTVCHKMGAKCIMKSSDIDYEDRDYDFECIDFVELAKRERLYDPKL